MTDCIWYASVPCEEHTDERCRDCCWNPYSKTKSINRGYGCNPIQNGGKTHDAERVFRGRREG